MIKITKEYKEMHVLDSYNICEVNNNKIMWLQHRNKDITLIIKYNIIKYYDIYFVRYIPPPPKQPD